MGEMSFSQDLVTLWFELLFTLEVLLYIFWLSSKLPVLAKTKAVHYFHYVFYNLSSVFQ